MRILILFLLMAMWVQAQEVLLVGIVKDSLDGKPVRNATLQCSEHSRIFHSNNKGSFSASLQAPSCQLEIAAEGYRTQLMVAGEGNSFLQVALIPETLSMEDWENESFRTGGQAYLGSGRSLFLRRVAFDLGQAFYRPRGLDGREQLVLLNGFPMNHPGFGRAQWSDWGGLNDVSRSQEVAYGLKHAIYPLYGLLGNTAISTDPLTHRPGLRITSSYSNRSYRGRLMLTYTNSAEDQVVSYTVSGSTRHGRQGYIEGTPYEAWSSFMGVNLKINQWTDMKFFAFYTHQDRGRSAPVTEEVTSLLGRVYNPYWGIDGGALRNSRMRTSYGPILQGILGSETPTFTWKIGAAWQRSIKADSRLTNIHAPSMDPVYYRYLPSYHSEHPVFPNRYNALISRESLLANPQVDWTAMRRANDSPILAGKAAYLLLEDVVESTRWWGRGEFSLYMGRWIFHAGIAFLENKLLEYARIEDLLGSTFHEDLNPFDGYSYDMEGPIEKMEGDKINYHLLVGSSGWNTSASVEYKTGSWQVAASYTGDFRKDHRKGFFRNEANQQNSLGEEEPFQASTGLYRLSVEFSPNLRHHLSFTALAGTRHPRLYSRWRDHKQHDRRSEYTDPEAVEGVQFRYSYKASQFQGNCTVYSSRVQELPIPRSFYAETGIGNDFYRLIQGRTTMRYQGLEVDLGYEWVSGFKVNAVVAYGMPHFDNDPTIELYVDTLPEKAVYSGVAALQDEPLGNGPQRAISLGIEYRDPRYWFIGTTFNYLSGAHLHPAILRRTSIFTEHPGSIASPSTMNESVSRQLPAITLTNLVFGKSYLKGSTYVGIFVSINNLFDLQFASGGFEQERKSEQGAWLEDIAGGRPLFGPKYWMGNGRTIFLNLSLSLR